MNNIKDADLLATFPPALKDDRIMYEMGRLIAKELHITAGEIRKNIIYARIDELAEKWLDVLAYDLHIDWYDYDYPIETKRQLLKTSVKIHKHLGTKYSVETALAAVYSTARCTEWFEYEKGPGEPYHFKIKVDVGPQGLTEDTSRQIAAKLKFYKNLRSHCDGIFYRLRAALATVTAQSYLEQGATMKVKALLPKGYAATAADVKALPYMRELNMIRVRPLLPTGHTAPAAETITKAGLLQAHKLRVLPLLADNITVTPADKVTRAGLIAANKIKVAPQIEKAITATPGENSAQSVMKIKNKMIIRKE